MTGLLAALLLAAGVVIVWLTLTIRKTRAEYQRWQEESSSGHRAKPEGHVFDAVLATPLFRTVASSVNAGLVILTPERTVHYLNARAEELLNVHARAGAPQGVMVLLRDYQAEEMIQHVLTDGEAREMTIQRMPGGRSLHLRCAPLLDTEQAQGVILIIHDVTQLSMLERARRDLVANVSHELRTPLSSLKLLVETVQSNPPPAVAQRMLEQMAQEIDMVTQLVDELHELSQIESGRVTLKLAPGSIEQVIRKTYERIRPQAERKHIRVEMIIDPTHKPVLMDEHRIGQVLLNLLHNAVKFTPDHGAILVQTSEVAISEPFPSMVASESRTMFTETIETNGPSQLRTFSEVVTKHGKYPMPLLPVSHPAGLWMVIRIADTGIGIPSQDLPRIFERFYKVDRSRNRDAGGTGLGLAIARHLVEGHGGRLWAESTEGKGSAFYFTLPLA